MFVSCIASVGWRRREERSFLFMFEFVAAFRGHMLLFSWHLFHRRSPTTRSARETGRRETWPIIYPNLLKPEIARNPSVVAQSWCFGPVGSSLTGSPSGSFFSLTREQTIALGSRHTTLGWWGLRETTKEWWKTSTERAVWCECVLSCICYSCNSQVFFFHGEVAS